MGPYERNARRVFIAGLVSIGSEIKNKTKSLIHTYVPTECLLKINKWSHRTDDSDLTQHSRGYGSGNRLGLDADFSKLAFKNKKKP